MVLQRAPKAARVWGYTPLKCEPVTVTLDGKPVQARLTPEESMYYNTHCMSSLSLIEQCKWVAVLPATPEGGPHTITASSSSYGKATITDVLFGDVWICGGQSNMAFNLTDVNDFHISYR